MTSHPSKQQQQQPKPPIILYRGWLDLGKHVWSPFVTKVEARLRFSNISYRTEAGSTRSAPNGKIPYIDFGDGQMMGDSALIIKSLVEKNVLPDLNGRLEAGERALDLGLRALLEEKLYFYGVSTIYFLCYCDFSVTFLNFLGVIAILSRLSCPSLTKNPPQKPPSQIICLDKIRHESKFQSQPRRAKCTTYSSRKTSLTSLAQS